MPNADLPGSGPGSFASVPQTALMPVVACSHMSDYCYFAAHSQEDGRRRISGLVSPKALATHADHDAQIDLFCTARLADAESSTAAPNSSSRARRGQAARCLAQVQNESLLFVN